MSNTIDEIFETITNNSKVENPEELTEVKKPRKKYEMSDEKRLAMLERLRIGRETKANKLQAKKEATNQVKPIIQEKPIIEEKKKDKEVINKDTSQKEKESFINMMAGKNNIKSILPGKPSEEKFIRPKKKEQNSPEIKNEIKNEIKKDSPQIIKNEIKINSPEIKNNSPIIPKIVIPEKEPIILRTFKKPFWG